MWLFECEGGEGFLNLSVDFLDLLHFTSTHVVFGMLHVCMRLLIALSACFTPSCSCALAPCRPLPLTLTLVSLTLNYVPRAAGGC